MIIYDHDHDHPAEGMESWEENSGKYGIVYDNLYLIVSDSSKDHAATVWVSFLDRPIVHLFGRLLCCNHGDLPIFYPHEWILLLPGEHLKNPMKSGSLVAESDCGKLDRKFFCHLSKRWTRQRKPRCKPTSFQVTSTSSDPPWEPSWPCRESQVTQMAKYLTSVYVSGWQCSSTASTSNEPGPDVADYPYDTVPNKAWDGLGWSQGMGAEVFPNA